MDRQEFYDSQIERKIRDYVDGNQRITNALRTLRRHGPSNPRRVLDIGCGIGQVSAALARRYAHAEVIAIDTNEQSIDVARQMFSFSGVDYRTGRAEDLSGVGTFDLIACIDVYEHIPPRERNSFHASIRSLLAPGARVVLTYPTSDFQAWIRTNSPAALQPVDEDIGLAELAVFSHDTGTTLQRYFICSAWRTGDYAHAVFTEGRLELDPVGRSLRRTAARLFERVAPVAPGDRSRAQRRRTVRARLGEAGHK